MKTNIFTFLVMGLMFFSGCGNQANEHEYTGILEGTSVRVPALTPGAITRIFVESGQSVVKGTLLATIDSIDFVYQKQQLTAALEELQVQVESARTKLSRMQKDQAYLKTKHDRIASLYTTQSVPKQQLDDISNQLQTADMAVINGRQTLAGIAAKEKQVRIQILSIKKRINDARITAPIGGIIASLNYESGEAIPQFGPLLEIINIDTLDVKIYLAERQLSMIKYGQNAKIKVDGTDEAFTGTISWISPRAEFTPKTIMTPDTRTSLVYAIKISVNNRNGILKDGMPVVIALL
ncbi:MAG: HlyD family efflux transporter periplasmic adaptor subunit [Calditrichales bacterium]|nr:MAG: HlyD family efflux transporter periplasmic adaptor subunit [Calditrichales bacterium]